MNSKRVWLIVSAILAALQIIGCAVAATVTPASPPAQTGKTNAVGEKWQQEWEKLAAEGKKEGQVVIGSSAGSTLRDAFGKGFTGKFGIELQFISAKPAELVPKLQSERRAGIYSLDLMIAGLGTVVPLLGPEGALESMDKVLLLPEVVDGKNWFGGDLLWGDVDHFQVMFLAYPEQMITVNADFVKAGEIKSVRDLLDPRWKGKIAFLDPTLAGSGNNFFRWVAETMGMDYVRQLEKQELVFTRDGRMMVEWVARGKYPVGIGIKPEERTDFIKAGVPLKANPVIEGTTLSPSGGGLVLMANPPHPKAAALFANWILSKEGQSICARVYGAQSAREDIPTDFLEPDVVRQPGVQYYPMYGLDESEKKRQYMDLAREMWGSLLK